MSKWDALLAIHNFRELKSSANNAKNYILAITVNFYLYGIDPKKSLGSLDLMFLFNRQHVFLYYFFFGGGGWVGY